MKMSQSNQRSTEMKVNWIEWPVFVDLRSWNRMQFTGKIVKSTQATVLRNRWIIRHLIDGVTTSSRQLFFYFTAHFDWVFVSIWTRRKNRCSIARQVVKSQWWEAKRDAERNRARESERYSKTKCHSARKRNSDQKYILQKNCDSYVSQSGLNCLYNNIYCGYCFHNILWYRYMFPIRPIPQPPHTFDMDDVVRLGKMNIL